MPKVKSDTKSHMEDIFQSFKVLIKKIAGQVQRTHQNQNLNNLPQKSPAEFRNSVA